MTDNDTISRIEAALEANPTPGPWFHCQPFQRAEKIRTIHGVVPAQRVDFVATEPKPVHKRIVIPMEGRESNVRSEDMAYIAACNPVAIRALLDRLKAAEGECERLRAELAEAHAENAEQARLLGISSSVEARLLAQADRDAAMLRQALEALEYAADATEPIRPDACGCPLCVAATAIRERLGEHG